MSNITIRSQQVIGYRNTPTRSGTVFCTTWRDGTCTYSTIWYEPTGMVSIQEHGAQQPPIDRYAPEPVVIIEQS